ncbi:Cys-tRNA(Pro) deacylase [Paenibacillus riograndensis]|uniref:Cys-tRNA(Pro)/Cys-tRNA(Cys) deacylase n=1 Tax=Paenibacillus riograndensis SBR5 TaxID=1073571 RepID=A0A0E4HCH1_9BACL|nr:Cys-tRNA(Pro) deacylase [Paenibacillus riograndensis]CQR56369.1 protein ebsC [Paenibacillus riograndensis SBR5]
MQVTKTNAMRILDTRKIAYEIHMYDNEDGQIHGTAVAEKVGLPPETVFKTLVAHSGVNLYVFVIPVAEELDLKKAAKAAGEKKIEMLPVKDLLKWTGYVRGGCSPVGMKKLYPTFIDSSAGALATMAVSGGKIGLQMELAPEQLAGVINAGFCELIK